MLSDLPNTTLLALACVLLAIAWWWWDRTQSTRNVTKLSSSEEDIALGPGLSSDASLIGAPQRPRVHPHMTQTVHSTDGPVSNNTMDAVATIRGTGLFRGAEIKPRPRAPMQRLNAQDILSATSRPRGAPTPGVYKKNSNRQIRPDPSVKEGIDTLPSVSTLKDIRNRETFSPLLAGTIDI